ncbi:MAG: trehalose-phosphatase [Actinomycetota bacterium]
MASVQGRLDRAAVFLDFDGTLAEIVRRPELARAVEGAREALETLARRAALVAIVTGRPALDVRSLIDVDAVEVHGLYGMEGDTDPATGALVETILPLAEAAAAEFPGAWVERKGLSAAVHVRETEDPDRAEAELGHRLRTLAGDFGLQLVTGKRVIELAAGRPSKGALVERLVAERGAEAALFAGDDLADLDAFDALDRLAAAGLGTVRVAVRGAETPPDLLERADVVVEGPAGLLALLRDLAA